MWMICFAGLVICLLVQVLILAFVGVGAALGFLCEFVCLMAGLVYIDCCGHCCLRCSVLFVCVWGLMGCVFWWGLVLGFGWVWCLFPYCVWVIVCSDSDCWLYSQIA